ncbi:hypothetical protein, partial [Thiolapillus sp.]|uniref:hypothetical protein n=1 Tax=Thiolapillus sp. TaxID=2017437 RepID=UPI003AF5CE14
MGLNIGVVWRHQGDDGLAQSGGRPRVSLPRDRFWDIQVSKIDSLTRQPLLPRPSCVRAASPTSS